jgi:hypothetical protein
VSLRQFTSRAKRATKAARAAESSVVAGLALFQTGLSLSNKNADSLDTALVIVAKAWGWAVNQWALNRARSENLPLLARTPP